MRLWDWFWIGERERPTTWKDLAVPLVFGVAGLGLFYPFLSCPCGQDPQEPFSGFANRCPTCEGQGRVSLGNGLWYGKPRVDPEDSATPDANP
jgi:hypothetical protein